MTERSNDVDQKCIDRLVRSLMEKAVRGAPPTVDRYAEGILADPQGHIDALVEAGVLKLADSQVPGLYEVVQPEAPHESPSEPARKILTVRSGMFMFGPWRHILGADATVMNHGGRLKAIDAAGTRVEYQAGSWSSYSLEDEVPA